MKEMDIDYVECLGAVMEMIAEAGHEVGVRQNGEHWAISIDGMWMKDSDDPVDDLVNYYVRGYVRDERKWRSEHRRFRRRC